MQRNIDKYNIIETNDGSKTIYISEMDEQYHSKNGAITEALHVYINAGYKYSTKNQLTIFEVGFGTGLNCLLTAIEADKSKRKTNYISIEKYPLSEELINQLNYPNVLEKKSTKTYQTIHKCEWNTPTKISDYFTLTKYHLDLLTDELPTKDVFDVIYYDAFGPDKQPEMWNSRIFRKIADKTHTNGVIVTYSAKGEVRRNWQQTGFKMERIAGPPGKREMLRGIKID